MKAKDFFIIFLIISLAAVAYYFYDQSEIQNANIRAKEAVLRVLELENGQISAEKEAFQVTNKELKEQIYIKDDSLKILTDKFKDFVGTTTIITKTRIDTVYIELPPQENEFGERTFSKSTEFYQIDGLVGENYVKINSLTMQNTQRLVIGRHKGFWNRTITAEITNSNPFIETTDVSTQVVLQEKVKRFGFGPFLGFSWTFEPVVGVGISYDLIRF